MRLLVSMGLKPSGQVGEPLRACLRWLDPATGAVEDALVVSAPPDRHPRGDHAECTGAHRTGDVLVQTTRTEVLRLHLPTLTALERFSHPLLADVHDALPLPDGGLAITATGHDSVLVFDASRRLVAHHHLAEGRWSDRYGDVGDFRRIPAERFKPHPIHPNHLALRDGELWVTCLSTQAFRPVAADHPPLRFPEGPPHDGRLLDGELWFTTVTGFVVAVDPATLRRTRVLDLAALARTRRMLGWCRGVEKVGDRLYVGMTMLRSSPHRELLRRALRGEAGRKLPTRVIEIDLRGPAIVAEHPVGNRVGGTIHALTAWPPQAPGSDAGAG